LDICEAILINSTQLNNFFDKVENSNKMKHPSKILHMGYYLQNIENMEFFLSTDIVDCYELLDTKCPKNPSDTLKKLRDGGKIIKKHSGYRISKQESELINSSLIDSTRLEKAYSPGDSYDFYDDVKKIINNVKSNIFLIDSYATEDIINFYLNKFQKGIKIKILTNDKPQGNFVSIATKFKIKHGKNFSVKTNKNCHDRVFFVDKKCYVTGQSLDKAASKQPTYICEIENSGSFRKIFEDLFNSGRTLI